MTTGTQPYSTPQIRPSDQPTNLHSGLEPLAEFAEKARALDLALTRLHELCEGKTAKAVGRLRQTLADVEPGVTMLGQVKSGKTSLVNALAGRADLLPSDVNPWTSVVTSLHLTPHETGQETAARFCFFEGDEWDRLLTKGGRLGELAERAGADTELRKIRQQITMMRNKSKARLGRKFELLLGQVHEYGYFDKNLVERYICLGDFFDAKAQGTAANQGRFADITKSADLYLHCDMLPTKLCLRDTPGVNDTFMMREQVTIRAIRDSRLCVVVLSAHQALTSVDMAVIRMISTLKARNVVIFVNRIDELSDPAHQVPEIRESIRETLKAHHGPVDAEVVFGSAFWANKTLAGDLDNLSKESSDALMNWAESSLSPSSGNQSAPNMVWELSGIPALYRALSTRIVKGFGQEALMRISRSAINLAGSVQAAEAITISRLEGAALMDRHAIEGAFSDLTASHLAGLNASFDKLVESYHLRADRAHGNFLERATSSLISHLEKRGDDTVWEYDPTGLRMLLRSAYTVFGARAQTATTKIYEATAAEVATLYGQAFGPAVEGITIAAPTAPHIQPPVCLGQTIAMDFKDTWWKSWWRRKRGYGAYTQDFHAAIKQETAGFLADLKFGQADAMRLAAVQGLTAFLDEQRQILADLTGRGQINQADAQQLFTGNSSAERAKALASTLQSLTACAA
ncbi:MAG: dynamin family protein [Rhodobacteraceae bacterium]|nr:dynamin family protein [Paracoccaceae bacterium]